mmetsp:Transcript_16126/g.47924  ORF Transcript_16126/g.47924 Transcript_16126/m.47924 type:complete len:255 (-) Transcript_16126:278-1042(-)
MAPSPLAAAPPATRRRPLPRPQPLAFVLAVLLAAACLCGASAQKEHWAKPMCDDLVHHFPHMLEHCHACIDATKEAGDTTRCHQCMKGHAGHHPPEELMMACLDCVPKAEGKRLGWACPQYCTHHGIINNKEQADDCMGCLMADYPKDKWACHVCMEQVNKDMDARRDCFSCIQDAQNAYQCASCARVPDAKDREGCFTCMKGGTEGKVCAKRYGVGEWEGNASMRENASLQEFMKKIGMDISHLTKKKGGSTA